MRINWKKVLLTIAGGSLAGSVGGWAGNVAQGTSVPFTAGTILLPAGMAALSSLFALFVKPPNQQ